MLCVAIGLLPRSAFPQQAVAVQRLGPQVGQGAPDFALQDQFGRTQTLSSIMGPKGALLVFFRSADWCPYCKTQLMELQGRANALRQQGLGLAAISYDTRAILADFTKRRRITYPLLSDPGSQTIKAYGILNTTVQPTDETYGIPFPGTFDLKPSGEVSARFFEEAYQERNSVSSILVRLGTHVDAPARKLSNSHLDAVVYTTDEIVAPGAHIALVVEVTPKPRMHLYAPGNESYKPVNLSIAPQPAVSVARLEFPPAHDYFYAPLKEHVKVYDRPFRLIQDVVFDGTPQGVRQLGSIDRLTLTGRLDYQACDDKVCFAPTSAALTWTFKVRKLDREP